MVTNNLDNEGTMYSGKVQEEQKANSWEDWDRIKDWHTRNLDSLKLSSLAMRASNTSSDKDLKDDKITKKDEICEGVPMSFVKANKLCKRFQSGVCDQNGPHALPSGTLLSHTCAMCLYKKQGVTHDHGAKSCTHKLVHCPVITSAQ